MKTISICVAVFLFIASSAQAATVRFNDRSRGFVFGAINYTTNPFDLSGAFLGGTFNSGDIAEVTALINQLPSFSTPQPEVFFISSTTPFIINLDAVGSDTLNFNLSDGGSFSEDVIDASAPRRLFQTLSGGDYTFSINGLPVSPLGVVSETFAFTVRAVPLPTAAFLFAPLFGVGFGVARFRRKAAA
ncbi:MAG: hypothetical protein AAF607_15800 [Pseudomonadota bacterium]